MKPLDVSPGQLWQDRADPSVVVEVRFVTPELLPWVRYWRPLTLVTTWAAYGSFKRKFRRWVEKGGAP